MSRYGVSSLCVKMGFGISRVFGAHGAGMENFVELRNSKAVLMAN